MNLILTLLTIAATVWFAVEVYRHFIKPHLSQRILTMITQDEQAIVDAVKALLAKVEGSDAALAAANQATADAQAALAAEKADHADLVAQLQALTGAAPAPVDQPPAA